MEEAKKAVIEIQYKLRVAMDTLAKEGVDYKRNNEVREIIKEVIGVLDQKGLVNFEAEVKAIVNDSVEVENKE